MDGDWLCHTLDVPLDRADPSAGTIPLHIYALPHSDTSQPEEPPFFTMPGGPGYEAAQNYALYFMHSVVNGRHDVITMDPRGTGQSAAIDCRDLQDGSASRSELDAAIVACGEQLGDASARYGSADRAMDVEAVRDLLGYDKIIFHGQSASVQDVQAYASRFADRLHAVVLDAGTVVNGPETVFGARWAQGLIERADTICRQNPQCTDAVRGLISDLAEEPIEGVTDSTAGWLLDNDANGFVQAAQAYAVGNPEPLLTLAAQNKPWVPQDDGDPTGYSDGANFAGNCTDQDAPFDRSDPVEIRRSKLQAAIDELPDDAFAPWSKEGWLAYSPPDLCIDWPAPKNFEPVLASADESFPGLPALIMVGDRDAGVENSRQLLDVFPDGDFVIVPGAEHPAMSAGSCVVYFELSWIEKLEAPGYAPCG